ncbi:hypothetical protein D3C79_997590 [compost metagenome]
MVQRTVLHQPVAVAGVPGGTAAEAAVAYAVQLAAACRHAAAGAAVFPDIQRVHRWPGGDSLPDPGAAVVCGPLPAVHRDLADAVDRYDRNQQHLRQPDAV